MVFAISATASDAQGTFTVMKEIIKSIFEKHGVGSIRPAVIVYGDMASVRLNFDEVITDLNDLRKRIDNLIRNSGTPDLTEAMSLARVVFVGARPHVKKVLVIITDDQSDSKSWEIKMKARELEEDEIEVVSVGIGAEVNIPQLKETTSYKENVIATNNTGGNTDELTDRILEIMLKSK